MGPLQVTRTSKCGASPLLFQPSTLLLMNQYAFSIFYASTVGDTEEGRGTILLSKRL